MTIRGLGVVQPLTALLGFAVAFRFQYMLEGTPFESGTDTGRLLFNLTLGELFLLTSIPLVFFSRRLTAMVSLFGAFLCFPLYLFYLVPGLFRASAGTGYWRWDAWAAVGVVTLVMVAVVARRNRMAGGGTARAGSPGGV